MKFMQALFYTLIGLWSCKAKVIEFPNIQSNGVITIVDSTSIVEKLLPYDKNYQEAPFYPIYYTGAPMDTFYLGKEPLPSHGLKDPDFGRIHFIPIDSNSMRIVIDTSMSLAHTVQYKRMNWETQKTFIDSTVTYMAYPVFFYNLTDSLLYLGQYNIPRNVSRQAKNKRGEWVDIEGLKGEYYSYGSSTIILGPSQLAVAKLIRFKGKIKTECRLKFYDNCGEGLVYSNIYIDYVDNQYFNFKKPKRYC